MRAPGNYERADQGSLAGVFRNVSPKLDCPGIATVFGVARSVHGGIGSGDDVGVLKSAWQGGPLGVVEGEGKTRSGLGDAQEGLLHIRQQVAAALGGKR